MTLSEAIVCLLASSNRGMKTDRIAAEINARGLYCRKDGMPVGGKRVYAAVVLFRLAEEAPVCYYKRLPNPYALSRM